VTAGWGVGFTRSGCGTCAASEAGRTDSTYGPRAAGFRYRAAIRDGYSRYVVAWRLSNALDGSFGLGMLDAALRRGRPEVFNTGPGSSSRPGRGPGGWGQRA
jgi:transposase InsO family protein